MTRRERAEARLQRRLEWAEKRDRKAAVAFGSAKRIADGIPMGQPILVGHHSEGHHRRDIARIDSGMRRGCESQDMAEHHRSKASGIEAQLERSIFSDDHDAVEKLEARIATLQAERDQMKRANAVFKKGGREALAALSPKLAESWDTLRRICPWEKRPFPGYALTNLGANIRRNQQRLAEIRQRAAHGNAVSDAAAALSGVLGGDPNPTIGGSHAEG